MSVKTTVTMPPQRSLVVDLNKIMDIPLPNLLEEDDNEKKLCSPNDGASVGGGSSGGVSVPLPPTPWNKIPYGGDNFHLEYIDLDKFLLENGIPASLEEELQSCLGEGIAKGVKGSITLLTPRELDEGGGDMSVGSPSVSLEGGSDGEGEVGCVAPAPEDVDVEVNFQPDPADLAMSSVPGGELFNPRKHRFSQEDLKPQPMIKKAKKVFVPDAQKDDKYWSRRKKNNVAAKRSRSARRLKENQITVRACFLERENSALRQEVAELRRGYGLCKSAASRYQAKYGLLQ